MAPTRHASCCPPCTAAIRTTATALAQAEQSLGKAVEAKVQQILSDGFVRLSSSLGSFDIKVSNPALQVGTQVQLDLTNPKTIALTILPQAATTPALLY